MSKTTKNQLFIKPPTINSDVINQVEIEMEEGYASIDDLHFWIDNPRVYTKVQKRFNDISTMSHSDEKDYIYETLIKTRDLDKLKKLVTTDGAINDPLYVSKDISGKTDRYIVYEGNSRLAVAMLFDRTAKKGIKPWNYVKVKKLPDRTTQESIRKLVGAFHMQGKNPWPPFELGGFIYRAVEEEMIGNGGKKSDALSKVSEEFGESKSSVTKWHKVMEFMKNMNFSAQEAQVSYWINYFAATHVKTRSVFNYEHPIDTEATKDVNNPKRNMYDDAIKKSIDYYLNTPLEKGGAAVGFRKDAKLISDTYNKHGKKLIITEFLNGDITMSEAALAAEDGGVGNSEYERIKEFRDWIIQPDTIRKLKKSTKKYTDLERFVDGIVLGLQQASKDLKMLRNKKK